MMGRWTSDPGELATVLRAWRDRLSPADLGLPVGVDRRVRGLRREELAAYAGLSVDYVVRLEQGRARTPSAQVVASLARVLQLDDVERDALYRVAGLLPPSRRIVSDHVPPGVQRLIARLGDIPLGVFAADWTLLSWTPLWSALLGDPTLLPPRERNHARSTFLSPVGLSGSLASTSVRVEGGVESVEEALVGDLRVAASTHPGDERIASLIAELRRDSPRFAALWSSGAAGVHERDVKTIEHPVVGDVTVDCDVLLVPGVDLKIVAYTVPAGSPAAAKIDFLRVTGASAGAAAGTVDAAGTARAPAGRRCRPGSPSADAGAAGTLEG